MSTALTVVGHESSLTYAETLRPGSFDALVKFAERMARTSFVPKSFQGKPDEIVAAVMFGAEVGLAPLQALQNVSVVNGRPTLWGDAALAVCQAHPSFESIKETHEGEGETRTAVCVVKRKGMDAHTSKFGAADAKRAGLWGKDTYKSYPDRMLQMRARGFALRNTFADALKGMVTREEAEDFEPHRAEVVSSAPTKSVTEVAREKIAASRPSALRKILADFEGATSTQALKAVAEAVDTEHMGDGEVTEMRAAFKVRAQRLREEEWRAAQAAKRAEKVDEETGEVTQDDHSYGPPAMTDDEAAPFQGRMREPGED